MAVGSISQPQPAIVAAFVCALETALGEQVGGPGGAGVVLALGDERSGAVAELELLAAEVAGEGRGGGFGAAKLGELAAPAGEPAGSGGFEDAAAIGGLAVSAFGIGHATGHRAFGLRAAGVDRK